MTPEQMRELADALEPMSAAPRFDCLPVAEFCAWLRQCAEQRPCTCHPDDNPPVPCAQKYALSECRAVHGEPTEAQIKARDALLDFISENGTASEGVQHYLDRYVRAALAAKDEHWNNYFAAQAMQPILLAAMQVAGPESRVDFAAIAAASFRMADEMLKAGEAA